MRTFRTWLHNLFHQLCHVMKLDVKCQQQKFVQLLRGRNTLILAAPCWSNRLSAVLKSTAAVVHIFCTHCPSCSAFWLNALCFFFQNILSSCLFLLASVVWTIPLYTTFTGCVILKGQYTGIQNVKPCDGAFTAASTRNFLSFLSVC